MKVHAVLLEKKMKESLLLKAEFLDDASIDSKESPVGQSPASAEL